MNIRRATRADLAAVNKLLRQVLEVHHAGRPDLFLSGCKKYADDELLDLFLDDNRPIFVAENAEKQIVGYAFCVKRKGEGGSVFTDLPTLYIDDICVDELARGRGVGKALYEYVAAYAKREGFARITLNVWSCNQGATAFYEKMGFVPYKVGMERIL